ncbi:protein kinase [Myxococcaceae bacterium GXIMD 01537]
MQTPGPPPAPPHEAPTLEPPGSGPGPAPAEPPFPVAGGERYQPVRYLGQGGMGQVFLAYEPLLRRNVALKFVRGDDPEVARRFLVEARAQARVRDERVCEVYEAGELQGRGYIAMRYVDGPSLGQLASTLTLEQKVLLLREAAEGVHAAHRAGLIHRDIKPSNILVERTPEGALRPFVMDFGLARDWGGDATATATGAVLGTPQYMAPEQARGEVALLDRRADVYSLGATLYFLLTGQPPFTGANSLEVLSRIQSPEEVRPPRSLEKDIPEDLEAIVLRCLEKERSARYDSARALVEDLDRYLAGEPVRARRAGLGYWLGRKVRKHRLAVSLSAAALLVLALALVQVVLARRDAATREHLSRRFTEQVERMEASARYSALARMHDTRADRKALRERMAALEAEVGQAGERAAGPGNYALGRALLSLEEWAGARERLESAWAQGFREPRVAWALAVVMGRLYQEQLLETERLRDATRREARRREVERDYRDPALAYLRQAEGAEVPSPSAYVSALLAFYEGRHEDALARLESVGTELPWFYEAPLLRGDILLARGGHRWNQGDRPGALADFAASGTAYATAASTAESAPAVHHALARLELAGLRMELYGAGDVLPHFQRGVEAATRALIAAPDHVPSLVVAASLHRRLAEQRTLKEGEVVPLLEKAVGFARSAVALAPEHVSARLELGLALRQWGRYRQLHGEDPREQLRAAIEAFEAIPPDKRDYIFHADLGLTFKVWADYEDDSGGDSLPHRQRAIDAYRAAIALDEKLADAWVNLGAAYLKRAGHARAADAEGDLTQARDALERALAINPQNIAPLFQGADVYEQLARRHRNRGQPYLPDLERALALYRRGLAINPRLPALHNGLGAALLWRAEQVADDGEDPAALLDEARAAFEQARAAAPQQAFAYNNLGEESVLRASILRARGVAPGPGLREALASYQRALEVLPRNAELWANIAKAHHLQAIWELEHAGDPRAELARADEALERARALNANNPNVWRYSGETRAVRARWLARQGQARDGDFEEAARAFDRAIELGPERMEYRVAAGHLQREWALWRGGSGGDAAPPLERGLALADELLKVRPRWAPAERLRAGILDARTQEGKAAR